jgi:hypothetical protein
MTCTPRSPGTRHGPLRGRESAVNSGQSRCPTDNQTGSSSAVIGRDGAAGPYMACKGSQNRVPLAPPARDRRQRVWPASMAATSSRQNAGMSGATQPHTRLPSRKAGSRDPPNVPINHELMWLPAAHADGAVTIATTLGPGDRPPVTRTRAQNGAHPRGAPTGLCCPERREAGGPVRAADKVEDLRTRVVTGG